jgi:hypothetical protein
VHRAISTISALPELAAARLVLSVAKYNSQAMQAASAANFRDLIPIDLS